MSVEPDPLADARLRRVAKAMREAFFAAFGDIDAMTPAEHDLAVRALLGIHANELIEICARFGGPQPLRDTIMAVVDAMIACNAAELATLMQDADAAAYLKGYGR